MLISRDRCTYCMSETCDRTRLITCAECEQSKPPCRFEDEDTEICVVCEGLLWQSLHRSINTGTPP